MHTVSMQWRRQGQPETRSVQVPEGETLLAAVVRAGLPIARSCGAQELCGRCGLHVVDGSASLSLERDSETVRKRRNRVDPELRLACTSRIHGPVTVTASYW